MAIYILFIVNYSISVYQCISYISYIFKAHLFPSPILHPRSFLIGIPSCQHSISPPESHLFLQLALCLLQVVINSGSPIHTPTRESNNASKNKLGIKQNKETMNFLPYFFKIPRISMTLKLCQQCAVQFSIIFNYISTSIMQQILGF